MTSSKLDRRSIEIRKRARKASANLDEIAVDLRCLAAEMKRGQCREPYAEVYTQWEKINAVLFRIRYDNADNPQLK